MTVDIEGAKPKKDKYANIPTKETNKSMISKEQRLSKASTKVTLPWFNSYDYSDITKHSS